ncbi:MAG: B12-binding domain-containing radical SAM protein [Nanoarchaeota archaeon]
MKILLCYAPFCTPASPPYSLAYLHSFLKSNLDKENSIETIDLNLEFHKAKFNRYQKYYKSFNKDYNAEEYDKITKEFRQESSYVYSKNNRLTVDNKKPDLFNELLKQITEKNPDIVAFSVVYSSQAFYTYAFCEELKKLGIKTIMGGPAVNSKIRNIAKYLENETELLKEIGNKESKAPDNAESKIAFPIIDFKVFNLKEYFSPSIVLPIKTSSSCYYRQCTFCTHHNNKPYREYPLETIKQTIANSKQKYFFIIDDMLSKARLQEFGKAVKELDIIWMCQLKPGKEFDKDTLKELHDSGLRIIVWGVESGVDRILKLMKKGTNAKDIEYVLKASHDAGIQNVVYTMFGFPTETKEEFAHTIEFLKKNAEYIDLVSTSIFGLQKNTEIYNNPGKFGIEEIKEEQRDLLDEKIEYKVAKGMSNEDAKKMRKNYKNTLEKLNKLPKGMNFFREHMLCLVL